MRKPSFSRDKRSGALESAPASFQEASCSVFKNLVNHHVDNTLKLVLGEYFHHENGQTLQIRVSACQRTDLPAFPWIGAPFTSWFWACFGLLRETVTMMSDSELLSVMLQWDMGSPLTLAFLFLYPNHRGKAWLERDLLCPLFLVSLGHTAAHTVPETKYMLWKGVQGNDYHLLEFHSFPGCGQQRAL